MRFDRIDDFSQPTPQLPDPDFGLLTFWRNAPDSAGSFWEGHWLNPAAEAVIHIALPGPFSGPLPEARAFALQFANSVRLNAVIQMARPQIEPIFLNFTERALAADLDADLKLAGISLDDVLTTPVSWELSFQVRDDSDLTFINVPMLGDIPQQAYLQT